MQVIDIANVPGAETDESVESIKQYLIKEGKLTDGDKYINTLNRRQ